MPDSSTLAGHRVWLKNPYYNAAIDRGFERYEAEAFACIMADSNEPASIAVLRFKGDPF